MHNESGQLKVEEVLAYQMREYEAVTKMHEYRRRLADADQRPVRLELPPGGIVTVKHERLNRCTGRCANKRSTNTTRDNKDEKAQKGHTTENKCIALCYADNYTLILASERETSKSARLLESAVWFVGKYRRSFFLAFLMATFVLALLIGVSLAGTLDRTSLALTTLTALPVGALALWHLHPAANLKE